MAGNLMIKLKSSEPNAEVIEVEVEVATKSRIIKQKLLEDFRADEPIPLLYVDAATLKKVIEWATHHKNDPEPTDYNEEEKEKVVAISPWDAEFLKVDPSALCDIISAAHYLDIKGLLDVSCKAVANMIHGMTADQIRRTFGIQNGFTPAQEEQLRKEDELLFQFGVPK